MFSQEGVSFSGEEACPNSYYGQIVICIKIGHKHSNNYKSDAVVLITPTIILPVEFCPRPWREPQLIGLMSWNIVYFGF